MYLDNAATTKIHPLVKEKMSEILYANYNAKYYDEAVKVKRIIDEGIENIADLLEVTKEEIVFTSGATESNNYIIKGIYSKYPEAHYITSSREHSSVLGVFEFLKECGANITIIDSEKDVIDFEEISPYIKENTKLVSIMSVNSETGIINDYKSLSYNLRERNILFHSDITQGIGKINFDFSLFDYLSFSAHKINGPKGIGVAKILLNEKPIPLLHGSSQQNNNRAGTLPNELIVGMSVALRLAIENYDENKKLMIKNKKKVINFLKSNLGGDLLINFEENVVDNIISVRIKNEVNQIFLHENKDIIKASTGSSCSIGNPSYVLKSHGFSDKEIQETIRISTSLYEEVVFDK